MLAALKSLQNEFDVTVIDAGAGLSRMARRLWLRATLVLLVTTSDDAAVMDAYAAMKRHVVGTRDASCENIRVLANRASSDREAADAHRRLANCCQRFLRQDVAAVPALPCWEGREDGSAGRHPRVWEAPNSEFGHAALWLGRAVEDVLDAEVQSARSGSAACKVGS
jgi:flagellar biosynthesis protein FlhG